MEHFRSAEWIDLVNQVVSPSRKLAMEKHLEGGCQHCAKEVSRWQRVRKLAATEASYQPPQGVVRMAKAAFAGAQFARGRTSRRGVIKVVFDSFLQPALNGIRSAGSSTRRMLYHADPFEIDLQIEARTGSRSIVVTGQLMDLRHPETVPRHVPVMLSNLRGRVVQTTTNQFGEFREEIEDSGDLELMVDGGSDNPLVLSLRDALGQSHNKKP